MLREEQIARAFYLEAKSDLKMAELAYENSIYSRCVSMSQQVVEKMLKAALAIVGVYGSREHIVSEYFVMKYNKIIPDDLLSKIVSLAQPIEAEWVRSRYPDWTNTNQNVWIPSEHYSKRDAEKALSGAKKVFEMIVDIMKLKFDIEL